MDRLPANTRRLLACGYLPPHVLGHAWSGCGYDGSDPTVCPGYSTSLPEVAEANRAHFHWSKGNLVALHREPSDAILRCVEILEGSRGAVTSWAMTPQSKGGGLDVDR